MRTSALPVDPYAALDAGSFSKVPVLIGVNHDEGRFFSQFAADWTSEAYSQVMGDIFGDLADQALVVYPFDGYASPYNAAYAIGAVFTDGAFMGNIGGCPNPDLAQVLSTRTRTYFYQFDDRHAPPLTTNLPGFDWGAAHAMELAYMWPSFYYEAPLAPQFTPGQRQLSREMVRYWGAFASVGAPSVSNQPDWPPYRSGQIMSLRPGGASVLISAAEYGAEHHCDFWRSLHSGATPGKGTKTWRHP